MIILGNDILYTGYISIENICLLIALLCKMDRKRLKKLVTIQK